MRTRLPSAEKIDDMRSPVTGGWATGRRVAMTLLIVVEACGKQDLQSELDRVRSWTSTTSLAAERREAGAIDRALARQLADRAGQARLESTRSLRKLTVTDAQRTAASELLDSLRNGITRLQRTAQ